MRGHKFSCSLVHLFKFFSSELQEWSRVSYKGDNPGIYHYYYYHYYYYFIRCEFFTPALVSWHSVQSRWQQVLSGSQDFSEYSGRPQQCNNLDGLNSSFDFRFFLSFFPKPFGTTPSALITFGITVILMFSGKVHVFVYLFAFLDFHCVHWIANSTIHPQYNLKLTLGLV